MTYLHCISYARGHRVKWVGVHGCCHSPFLVNEWWIRYVGRCPIELHGLHGCKSTLCMVLMVRAWSRDNVLKSKAVSENVQMLLNNAAYYVIDLSVTPWLRDGMWNVDMCAHTYWVKMKCLRVIV